MLNQTIHSRRSLALLGAIGTLAVVSVFFYYRQNFSGQIGGRMSVAKLLWLDYAIIAWLIFPFFVWRSPSVVPSLRWIYGAHLVNFAARAVIELWMLYVTISWIPPYGITQDLFSIALITGLLWWRREELRWSHDQANQAALRFLTSIRVGLSCEIVFAWLFYRTIGGEIGIYFASPDPVFSFINGLTWAAVFLLYPDLLRTLWAARDVLFPVVESVKAEKRIHA
ncbi:MAG: hypothetical protein ACREQA_21765 [Candidatus Binatia bacterium]